MHIYYAPVIAHAACAYVYVRFSACILRSLARINIPCTFLSENLRCKHVMIKFISSYCTDPLGYGRHKNTQITNTHSSLDKREEQGLTKSQSDS